MSSSEEEEHGRSSSSRGPQRRSARRPARYTGDDMSFSSGEESRSSSSEEEQDLRLAESDEDVDQEKSEDDDEEDEAPTRPVAQRRRLSSSRGKTAPSGKKPTRRSSRRAASCRKSYNEDKLDADLQDELGDGVNGGEEEAAEDDTNDEDSEGAGSSSTRSRARSTPSKPIGGASGHPGVIPLPEETKRLQIETILARRKKYKHRDTDAMERRHKLISAAADGDEDGDDDTVSNSGSPAADNDGRGLSKDKRKAREDDADWEWEYLIKWKGFSYLHVSWETRDTLGEIDPVIDRRIERWVKKMEGQMAAQGVDSSAASALGLNDDEDESEPFDPSYTTVERVLASNVAPGDDGKEALYLVKWMGLGYDECTWERGEDVGDEGAISAFRLRQELPPKEVWKPKPRPQPTKFKKLRSSPEYGFGKTEVPERKSVLKYETQDAAREPFELRNYQLEGLNWLIFNWFNERGSILADEMGLGKTAQILTFFHYLATHNDTKNYGPFLVVAPLSTIEHWARETKVWGDGILDSVVYHGRSTSREIIRHNEFFFADPDSLQTQPAFPKLIKSQPNNPSSLVAPVYKFNVLITTYEMAMADRQLLAQIPWQCIVVDEAHRLKNRSNRLYSDLQTFKRDHTILLTGTPIQNEIRELWALLHFLHPEGFPLSGFDAFLRSFGELRNSEQVQELHKVLRPYLLRRLKSDVDDTLKLPPKQETIVEVELTAVQKQYYRAIYERNTNFLLRGGSAANAPNLMNVMMELRKCCNHPFLVHGVEENLSEEQLAELQKQFQEKLAQAGSDQEKSELKRAHARAQAKLLADQLVNTSGKMVLLDKLLPRFKKEGHRVLIFSQMVRMLDILQDYCTARKFGFERLDGRVRGPDRQKAIDRFSDPDADVFVMLLSTRAGGLGINLTAADTVIIFDSDWNPQNDLQAQARAHRIGQKSSVKIYRLITRKTYEQHMFHQASLKLGLDQAVIGGMREGSSSKQGQLGTKDVEGLLKRGAYDVFNEGEEGDRASQRFCEEDIDTILQRSTTVVWEGSEEGKPKEAASNEFSKASFVTSSSGQEVDLDDPEFWTKQIGLDAPSGAEVVEELGGGLMMNARGQVVDEEGNVIADRSRRRKQVARYGGQEEEERNTDEAQLELYDSDDSMGEYGPDDDDAHSVGEKSKDKRGIKLKAKGRKYGITDEELRIAMEGGSQNLGLEDKGGWNLRKMYEEEKRIGSSKWGNIDSPWTAYERHKFHTAIWKYGWGRWHAIRLEGKLWKRTIPEIKIFARAYLQCAVHNARRALDLAEKTMKSVSDTCSESNRGEELTNGSNAKEGESAKTGAQRRNVFHVRLQNWMDRPLPGQRVMAEAEAMCPPVPKDRIPSVLLEQEFQTRLDADSALKLLERFEELMRLRDLVSIAAARYVRDRVRVRHGYSIRVDDYAGFSEEQTEEKPLQKLDPPFSSDESSAYPSNREDVQHTDLVNMPWPKSGQNEENAKSFESWGSDDHLLFDEDLTEVVVSESKKRQLPKLKSLPILLDDNFSSDNELEKHVKQILSGTHHISQAIPSEKLPSQDDVPPHLVCDELLIETVPRDELIKRIPIVPRGWFSADTSRPSVSWWKYPYDDGHLVLACYLDGFGKVDTLATDPRLYYCSLLYDEYNRLPEDKKLPKVPRVVMNAKGRQRTALMLQAAKGYLDPEKAHFQLPPPAPAGDEPDLREEIDIGMEIGEVPNEIRAAYLMISVQAINRHVRRLTHPVPNRGLTSRYLAKHLKQSFGGVYVPVTLKPLPFQLRPVVAMPKRSLSAAKEESTSKKRDTSKASGSSRSTALLDQASEGLRLDENVALKLGGGNCRGKHFADDAVGHDCLEGVGGNLRGPAPRGKASTKGSGLVEYYAPSKAPTAAYAHDKSLKQVCEDAINSEISNAWQYAVDANTQNPPLTELERLCQWVFLGSCGKQNDLTGTSLADYHSPSSAPEKSAAVIRQDWGKLEKRRLESALNRFGLPDERLHTLPSSYEKVVRSFGIANEKKSDALPFFTWKDLVASAQLSKPPEVAYEYVMCSFLPHVMAIAAGSGGAHLDLEEPASERNRGAKYEEESKSVDDEDDDSEDQESVDDNSSNRQFGKMASINESRPRPSQFKRQYRGTRVLDPEIDLHLIGLTGRLFSRQLLTRISLIGGIRWMLSHLDFDNSLAMFLRCSSFRKHISSESMELHSNHSEYLLNSAYIVNSSSCSSASENRRLPTWWCPWVHDVALLRLVGQYGLNMGHSAGSFSRSKTQSVDNDQEETDQASSSVDSSWGWIRSNDSTHPLHPVQIEKHCWAVFFERGTEFSATAQTAFQFMPPSDMHRLKVMRECLVQKYPTSDGKKQFVDELVAQWPSDSLIEARLMCLATHLSPFRSAMPRVLGPVSRVTLPAQRQDVLSLESREEMLRCLWSEAVEEQWGWSEADSWAFLADMSPASVSLRGEAGWWHWGTRHAPSVFPAEEQWSAWGCVRGNPSDACLWGSSSGHLPSSVFVPKPLRNGDDAGCVVSSKRARYLSRVYVDDDGQNLGKRYASDGKENPVHKAKKLSTESPGRHGQDIDGNTSYTDVNGVSGGACASSNTQRGFRSYSSVSDPFLSLASTCANATSLCTRKAEVRTGKGSTKPMHSSLRVLNILYDCSSGNPNAPPSWPPNQGHSWVGLGEGVKSRSKNTARKGTGFLSPKKYDFHVAWRGMAGSGRPLTVPPPDKSSSSIKTLSSYADVVVHVPKRLYTEYEKWKCQAYRCLRNCSERRLWDSTGGCIHGDVAEGAAKAVVDALSGKTQEEKAIVSAARTALSGENVSTTRRYCPEYDFIAKQSMEIACSKEGKEPKRVDKRIARGVAVAMWHLVQDVEERVEGKKSIPDIVKHSSKDDSSDDQESDYQSAKAVARTVKSPTITGKRRRRHDVSLKELMDAGFVHSGKDVLQIKFRGGTFSADLNEEGYIVENGVQYPRPSSWSLPVKRRIVPEKQTDDGWYSIKYNGTPLISLKHEYVDRFNNP
eukprot:gb/GECG01011981.1/.p1 GENE.gb/GECG01011981.1/~~gb/GECG01011981.1/.p1  ORF type:complete len:2995 (+),score=398.94 gb/GECG01011981.1/:1-8985(+)